GPRALVLQPCLSPFDFRPRSTAGETPGKGEPGKLRAEQLVETRTQGDILGSGGKGPDLDRSEPRHQKLPDLAGLQLEDPEYRSSLCRRSVELIAENAGSCLIEAEILD